ncbi:MAG: helicase C-terminal domain-containing protein [Planctomycetota bacterium]|nr:helicase C-terminal domain-containing protein [Planctomycetota bacterium]
MIVPPKPTAVARRNPLAGIVFVTIWATGSDPALARIVRVTALKATGTAGEWDLFERLTNPFADQDDEAGRTAIAAHIERDFGIARAQFGNAASADDAWEKLIAFIDGAGVVAPDADVFESWFEHFARRRGGTPPCIAPCDVAALFLPGRLASKRAELVSLLTRADVLAHGPLELHAALVELAQRIHALAEDVLRIAVLGYKRAWDGLVDVDPRAAMRIQLAFALLDRPSMWTRAPDGPAAQLVDGRIVTFGRDASPLEDLIEDVEPRCATERDRFEALEGRPADSNEAKPFHDDDMATLDAIFERLLPANFAKSGAALAQPTYRPSQHQVAREVAKSLGADELLLVHAPTGTGKTLAYLVPAMLWAKRHGVRVGVATYTRALQEQAMDREVPRALSMLAAAGISTPTFVTVLKGRDNYVCWRALKHSTPEEDSAEAWFAWTYVAVFAMTDADADLDRLPTRSPIALESTEAFQRALQAAVRSVRGLTACCTRAEDKRTCAAEVARKRAEKSHVVIVNQAFALARQEFFRHIVFDECEHLHEQAHSAWSRTIGFRDVRNVLALMRQPGRVHSRALLDRLKRSLLEGTPSGDALDLTIEMWTALRSSVDVLHKEVEAFETWRSATLKERVDREEHSMLREFVLEHGSDELVQARVDVVKRGNALDALLAALVEYVDQLHLRNSGALRRAFDRSRFELNEIVGVIDAWIPIEEGKTRFRPSTFYDVERDHRGDVILAARVLLPNEFLGRNYYPELKTGVFISATTWLQDGFSAARAYLGLDRAEHPAEDEERAPSKVRTFRAPDVFDYSRVLVAIPRDAPVVGADKGKFLEYVRRFVTYLGERTNGRMLVLFTNSSDVKKVGEETSGFFRARRIPLWFQNMEGSAKEELSDLFRSTIDSILFGVDTFWYGADFPGETLEYLVIVRLPYGVPDRYHHAQCATIGLNEQRRQIYVPRALAKFRQGFGRLMRRESDRGCVFVLDGRIGDPRHRFFLRELPIERSFDVGTSSEPETKGARLVRGDTDHCVHEALAHMHLLADVKRRGLDSSFHSEGRPLRGHEDESMEHGSSRARSDSDAASEAPPAQPKPTRRREPPTGPIDISREDLPF